MYGVVKWLCETFVTFGIHVPEEMMSTSNGGPQFKSRKDPRVPKTLGVRHRISSDSNPRANCRAELAVKRMLMDNINPGVS